MNPVTPTPAVKSPTTAARRFRAAILPAALSLAAGLALPGLSVAAPAAAARPDPWARVPALTTGCYQTSDDFPKRLAAALEATEADLARQQAVNDSISEELKNIDMMQLAQRQQEYMMAHPEEAMKLMQQNADLGQTTADTQTADAAKRIELEKELKDLEARYKPAVDAIPAQFKPKHDDLAKRAEAGGGLAGEAAEYTGWALQEYTALLKAEDAAYQGLCATWWSATGPYHAWLKRYREQLVREIPQRETVESHAAGMLAMVISTPERTWRPTSAIRNVRDYLTRAGQVFGQRKNQPLTKPK